ncbi:MAG: hypothetical protein MHPSP_000980 [Paramarteilia canceri]
MTSGHHGSAGTGKSSKSSGGSGGSCDGDDLSRQAAAQNAILCINGCGFFGSPVFANYCSSCFRQINASTDAVLDKTPAKETENDNCENEKEEIFTEVNTEKNDESQNDFKVVEVVPEIKPPEQADKTRCANCNKKLGLTGIECRCGLVLCSTHRYSDRHECVFEYKKKQQELLKKSIPKVYQKKIQDF